MRCYLCDSINQVQLRDKVRFDRPIRVFRCEDCTLVYLEPSGRDLREWYRGEYRQAYSPEPEVEVDSEGLFDTYLPFQAERVEQVRRYLPESGGRLLDVGCSAGHFLHAMREHVAEAVGIELNEANAEFARERLGFAVHTCPAEETDLTKGSFDLITVFHTLEHMPDPRRFLRTIQEYLTPAGTLFVEVPNVDDALLTVYDVPEFADFWYREPHLFNFSPATLHELMLSAGLDGEADGVQRYGLLNHAHWMIARRPQPSAASAMAAVPIPAGAGDERARQLRQWFLEIDAQYRELLCATGASESITFAGRRVRGES